MKKTTKKKVTKKVSTKITKKPVKKVAVKRKQKMAYYFVSAEFFSMNHGYGKFSSLLEVVKEKIFNFATLELAVMNVLKEAGHIAPRVSLSNMYACSKKQFDLYTASHKEMLSIIKADEEKYVTERALANEEKLKSLKEQAAKLENPNAEITPIRKDTQEIQKETEVEQDL